MACAVELGAFLSFYKSSRVGVGIVMQGSSFRLLQKRRGFAAMARLRRHRGGVGRPKA